MKYRKKPVVIEAHEAPPADEDLSDEMLEFLAGASADFK